MRTLLTIICAFAFLSSCCKELEGCVTVKADDTYTVDQSGNVYR